jgi:hypothetical protein
MRDDRMAGRSYFVEAGFETTAERTPSSNSRSRSRFRSRSRRRGGRDLEPPQKQALDEFFEEAREQLPDVRPCRRRRFRTARGNDPDAGRDRCRDASAGDGRGARFWGGRVAARREPRSGSPPADGVARKCAASGGSCSPIRACSRPAVSGGRTPLANMRTSDVALLLGVPEECAPAARQSPPGWTGFSRTRPDSHIGRNAALRAGFRSPGGLGRVAGSFSNLRGGIGIARPAGRRPRTQLKRRLDEPAGRRV